MVAETLDMQRMQWPVKGGVIRGRKATGPVSRIAGLPNELAQDRRVAETGASRGFGTRYFSFRFAKRNMKYFEW